MNDLDRQIELEALKCELAGMLAENEERSANGLALAYSEETFFDLAQKMRELKLENYEEKTEFPRWYTLSVDNLDRNVGFLRYNNQEDQPDHFDESGRLTELGENYLSYKMLPSCYKTRGFLEEEPEIVTKYRLKYQGGNR